MKDYGYSVEVFDPVINKDELGSNDSFKLTEKPKEKFFDVVIIAVDHSIFLDMSIDEIYQFCDDNLIIFDVKSLFPRDQTTARL